MAATLIAVGIAALGACGSPETRYFTLASVSNPGPGTGPATTQPLWIEVSPVHVPERLNRSQLVLGNSANGEQQRLEFARWAAPLPDELRDTFAQQLQEKLPATDIYRRGLPDTEQAPIYRVAIEVLRLDADPGRQTDADISWQVKRLPDGKFATGHTRAILPAPGGVEGVVAAYRRIVANTVDDIAAALRGMRP